MKSPFKNHTAGFTLLEMLVAMGVTIVLLSMAVQIFRDATYSNQVVVQAAETSDNLRAGLNLIQEDLQQAGTGIPVGGVPIPFSPDASGCTTTAPINRPVPSVQGVAMTTFPKCNATIPAVEPGNEMGPPITAPDATAGTVQNPSSITDEITLMYEDNTLKLDSLSVNNSSCPNGSVVLSGNTLTVKFDTNCLNLATAGIAVNTGDLIILTNPNATTMLCVTAVSTSANTLTFAPGDAFGLNGRSDTGGTIKQLATSGCTSGANSCFPGVLATRVWMISYYLDNWTAPPFVRLIRQVNFNTPTPVGETLENLQFTYNFVDGITNPAGQATVPVGNSESQIRAVNVYLAARSSYMGHQGNQSAYSRSNLVTQVSLRSMAYVNRYN